MCFWTLLKSNVMLLPYSLHHFKDLNKDHLIHFPEEINVAKGLDSINMDTFATECINIFKKLTKYNKVFNSMICVVCCDITYSSDGRLFSISCRWMSHICTKEDHWLLEHHWPGTKKVVQWKTIIKTKKNSWFLLFTLRCSIFPLTCPAGEGCC